MRPLDGVRVLDLSRAIAGPFAGRLLSDLGADVVKIEPPEGDMMRSRMPLRAGASTSFGQLNAGKRSIVLDMKTAPAAAAVRRLAQGADVVGAARLRRLRPPRGRRQLRRSRLRRGG